MAQKSFSAYPKIPKLDFSKFIEFLFEIPHFYPPLGGLLVSEAPKAELSETGPVSSRSRRDALLPPKEEAAKDEATGAKVEGAAAHLLATPQQGQAQFRPNLGEF